MDEFSRVHVLKTKQKIKSVDLYTDTKQKLSGENNSEFLADCKIACLLQNNQVELYGLKINKQLDKTVPEILAKLDAAGHRSDVRTLCFSSDSTAIVSASGDSMKVWNRMNLTPIRTFSCDYALSSLFISDDNHVLIGTNVS